MAYQTAVQVQDAAGEVVNPGSEELLRAILSKIPLGMSVNAANQLRVVTDTNATILNSPWFMANPTHLTIAFEGQQVTNQRWLQQRSLLSFA
jgi:hypothetical protein